MGHRWRWMVWLTVWWLMVGWGQDARILAGPFETFSECNQVGLHLPYQYAGKWHCEIG